MLCLSGSADAVSGDCGGAREISRVACGIFGLAEWQSEVFKMLTGQSARTEQSMRLSANAGRTRTHRAFRASRRSCIAAPSDLTLSVPDRQDRNSTTRADLLQRPQRG